jgi:hypothetical protein
VADDETRLSNDDTPTVLSGVSGSSQASDSDAPTVLSFGDPIVTPSASGGRPIPIGGGPTLVDGEVFGPYTIGRLLGRGGMGEVYASRHHETGRDVALKVLRGRLNQREDRARFLREGQLAASLSHPHTVYIFGSEEIDGLPVISMQLVAGGTLRDRVVDRGPMPVAEAVDAVLDIISGLDAAESAGILHRDIKPSNCFVDADGRVKVGDFGLSIPVGARDAESKGFQGTPQYAPPEQLRGEPLDVRADIYAVGATLFYLLTGRAVFEAANIDDLVQRVKTSAPPSPQALQPKVPAALAAIVLRCLAKDRDARPASYTELARALRPFGGLAMPAPRGIRLIAGVIDALVVAAPVWLLNQTGSYQATSGNRSASVDSDPWMLIVGILYFAFCEWRWGATLGKRLLGLRVVSTSGELSWRQSLGRALIFYAPGMPLVLLAGVMGEAALADFIVTYAAAMILASVGPITLSLLLFSTMTRRNGLAAVQDLLTGSRVVQRRFAELRRAAAPAPVAADAADSPARERYGSFEVGRELGPVPGGRLRDGVDVVLRRRVWIVDAAPGTPETTTSRREVDRVGRLHWLAGSRSERENWDAFEAPPGAVVDPTPAGSPWGAVQGWLNDLAAELAACDRDGSIPRLSLDRVWIRHDGRAVLLDFPGPGVPPASNDIALTPRQLLMAVGQLALGHQGAMPMPVSAVAMLDRWARKPNMALADALSDLAAVAMSPDRVARGRRLLPLAASAVPVVLMLAAALIATSRVGGARSPENLRMLALLDAREKEADPARQRAIDTYLAGTMGDRLDNDAAWQVFLKNTNADAEMRRLRKIARGAATLHPSASETAEAAAAIQPLIEEADAGGAWGDKADDSPMTIIIALLLIGSGMSFVSGVVSVLVRPSGLIMSALGLAVLTVRGRETSRLRALWRLVIAWSPVLVYSTLLAMSTTRTAMQSMTPVLATVALLSAGVFWTMARPIRGPHDIAAGTRIGGR